MKKVYLKEKISLENGRRVEIFDNGVKKVELKADTYRTVSQITLVNFQLF